MSVITYNRNTNFNIGTIYQVNGVNATTGMVLLFTVKSIVDSDPTDSSAILLKNLPMSGSQNVISIEPGDIKDTNPPGNYIFDISVIDSVLGVQPLLSGKFILTATARNRYVA